MGLNTETKIFKFLPLKTELTNISNEYKLWGFCSNFFSASWANIFIAHILHNVYLLFFYLQEKYIRQYNNFLLLFFSFYHGYFYSYFFLSSLPPKHPSTCPKKNWYISYNSLEELFINTRFFFTWFFLQSDWMVIYYPVMPMVEVKILIKTRILYTDFYDKYLLITWKFLHYNFSIPNFSQSGLIDKISASCME